MRNNDKIDQDIFSDIYSETIGYEDRRKTAISPVILAFIGQYDGWVRLQANALAQTCLVLNSWYST